MKAKRMMSVFLIVILIVNMILMALGKVSIWTFWIVILFSWLASRLMKRLK